MIRRPPRSPLFPCTTLFRSVDHAAMDQDHRARRPAQLGGRIGGQRRDVAGDDGARPPAGVVELIEDRSAIDRKSTRLNSSHLVISYAVFCLKKQTILVYPVS